MVLFKRALVAFTGFAGFGVASNALALVATDLDPIATEVTAAVAIIAPWAFGLLASVMGFLIALKLVRRAGSKAT